MFTNVQIALAATTPLIISGLIFASWYFGIVGIVTTGTMFIGIDTIPIKKILLYAFLLLVFGGGVTSVAMTVWQIFTISQYRLALYEIYGFIFSYLTYRFYFQMPTERVWQLLFYQFALMIAASSAIQFMTAGRM